MENQNVEYKESWRDEYLKWICGFCNAHGGTLYIGVDDKGIPCGVSESKKLLEDIPNKILNMLGITCDVDLEEKEGKDVIKISVPENLYPVSFRGAYYYRSGATNQLLQGNNLTTFLMRKTGIKWDGVPVDTFKVEDLDKESFDIFRREARISKRLNAAELELSDGELLERLNLIENGMLKRAAVLLFYRKPEKLITGSFIKIGFFENDWDLRYQDEIQGSLMMQAERAIDLLYTKYLIAEISYQNVTRVETYPFPKEAVREAIFNAIVHKDYSASIPIQISVYRDKLYIGNDCVLPPDWTAETFLGKHKSIPYNPDIANTFYKAGFIESWGRGIEKICTICKEYGTPEPEYVVHSNDIMVCFKANVPQNVPQNRTLEELILREIKNNNRITRQEIADIAGVNIKTIARQLKNIPNVKYVGAAKNGYWKIEE